MSWKKRCLNLGMFSLILFCLEACMSMGIQEPENPGMGTPFEAMVGKSLAVGPDQTPLMLTVLEDSRCPIGAQCMWAGQARIEVRWGAEPNPAVAVLTLPGGETARSSVAVGSITLECTALLPYPTEGKPRAERYTATVVARPN